MELVSRNFTETLTCDFARCGWEGRREGKGREILPLEEPLPEELLSVPEDPLAEVSPDAEPDAEPDVDALLSPVALPLASAEPPPDEVALPPWVLLTMKAAPSWVSPLLLLIESQHKALQKKEDTTRPTNLV
jgi:hypothetical protein